MGDRSMRRTVVAFAIGAGCCSAFLGCSTYAVERYAVSASNVTALRTLRGQWINVGPFTAPVETASLDCRMAGPVKTADGEPYSQTIRAALISELEMAEVYAPTAPVTLTGSVDKLDFDSLSGEWTLSLTLTSSNGKSLHADEKYHFASSYMGDAACAQTAQAFMPSVQDLIAKVVHSPAFPALVGAPSPAPAVAPPAAGPVAAPTTI
jgi:hypothetical protein